MMKEQERRKRIHMAKKFSYSKLNTYDSCGFKYYLSYVLGNFISGESIAIDLGVLIHYVEESIFNSLKEGEEVDYDHWKEFLQNADIPKKSKFDTDGGIFGLNILKEKYKEDYYKTDNNGQSYYTKMLDYTSSGMYRLETYLKENPTLKPFAAEKFFSFTYRDQVFSGYIDRIFYDTATDEYIIEDIKTKGKPFKDEELVTPLQFVIYMKGLNECLEIPLEKMKCAYDLPILGIKQKAGTPGFFQRGMRKIDSLFDKIEIEDFTPHASPLCAWCQYSSSNPGVTEEGKYLCPYHSLWSRENKTREVSHKWRGVDFVAEDQADEKAKCEAQIVKEEEIDFDL